MSETYEDAVRCYARRMYGSNHMQLYLQRRSDTLVRLIREAGAAGQRLRILEVGCGPGLSLRHLAQLGTHALVGLDRTASMLAQARQNTADTSRGPSLIRGTALDLPFREETFDVVYCTRFIHQFEDKAAVYRELARVTRPGGRLIVEFYRRPYHVLRYYAQWVNEKRRDFMYHFPPMSEVRDIVGPHVEYVPLRLAGERLLHAVLGPSRADALLDGAWHTPLRLAVDEYFTVAERT